MSRPTALVTGASRGIGLAIARHLAIRGCRVAVHFNSNRAAADAALESLSGDDHAVFGANLAMAEDRTRLWSEVTAAFGQIDILVNNAGTYDYHPPLETPLAAWRAAWENTLGVNLFGPADLCHFAANAMRTAAVREPFGRGRIVNISSRGAFRGEPAAPAYGASKAGLNALSQSLAKALGPESIYVFCLAPGWVDTDMADPHIHGPRAAEILGQQPLGRVATVEEIAQAASFCALDAPPTMTGSIIDINGASYLRT